MRLEARRASYLLKLFWRRWHMTLSRFVREYLYSKLKGNPLGLVRCYAKLAITAILGSLRRGAVWMFVAWGALDGLRFMIGHAWRELVAKPLRWGGRAGCRFANGLGNVLAVVIAWVFFRAKCRPTARSILRAAIGIPLLPVLIRR